MSDDWSSELARQRREIDAIDHHLVEILAQRFKVTHQVGLLKARVGLPAVDPARDHEKIAHIRQHAAAAGLNETTAEAIIRTIIAEVVKEHEALRKHDGR